MSLCSGLAVRAWQRHSRLWPAARVEIERSNESMNARSAARVGIYGEFRRAFGNDEDVLVAIVAPARLELVSGRAYFDAGGPLSPRTAVVIVTPLGAVADLGSRYEIRLEGGGESALWIRVDEGMVSIRKGAETYAAAGGEEVRVDPDGIAYLTRR